MRRTWSAAAAALMLTLTAGGSATAAQLCGWMVEETSEENYHHVELWLEADRDMAFFYRIGGEGLSEDSGGRAHSPSSGTFSLDAGKPEKPWGFGVTLYPPGAIDVVAEIRETPQDIFSDEETPLLAAFAFRRQVPAEETEPPADLAQRQCATLEPR